MPDNKSNENNESEQVREKPQPIDVQFSEDGQISFMMIMMLLKFMSAAIMGVS